MTPIAAVVLALVATQKSDPAARIEQALADALFVADLAPAEFRVQNPLIEGNPLAVAVHAEPSKAAARMMEFASRLEGSRGLNVLGMIRTQIDGDPNLPAGSRSNIDIDMPPEIPATARPVVERLARYVAEANEEVRQALSGLSPDEKRDLVESLPRFAVHPTLRELDFVGRPIATWSRIRILMARVDRKRIRNAAERLSSQVETEVRAIDGVGLAGGFKGKFKFNSGGMTIVVGGTGDDEHQDRDAQLTIDFGGDDRYTGRHGAGIGYASVQFDASGSDTYDLPDVSLGAGLLGIGLAWDLNGDDRVHARSLSLGAGIAGVGRFRSGAFSNRHGFDFEGDGGRDVFRSDTLSQGFGFFGFGVFERTGSEDQFISQYLSQGAALTEGVGWLVSRSGGQTFVASGLAPSLESDQLLSARSQGFGGRAGTDLGGRAGMGLLCIGSAESRMLRASSQSQGCGVDGGTGYLLLSDGASVVTSHGFGQGFGLNQGVGMLLGGVQNDSYLSRSPSQGAGAESGLGILVDRGGNDLYDLGQGTAGFVADGAIALRVDIGGGDRYIGAPRLVFDGDLDRGISFGLDLGSGALVSVSAPSDRINLDGSAFFDLPEGAKESVDSPLPNAGKAPDSDAGIETALYEASGLAPYASKAIRIQARLNLEAAPARAVQSVKAIAVRRPLRLAEVVLLGEICRSRPEAAEAAIGLATDTDPSIAAAGLAIIGEAKLQAGTLAVLAGLKRPETAIAAARAASALGLNDFSGELMLLAASTEPSLRREAAKALAKTAGPEALATAQSLLGNYDSIVRRAAAIALGKLSRADHAVFGPLLAADDATARSAVFALGRIGSPEALALIGPCLESPRPGVRLEALLALHGRCPPEFRAKLNACRNDADRRVRMVAAGIDPGR